MPPLSQPALQALTLAVGIVIGIIGTGLILVLSRWRRSPRPARTTKRKGKTFQIQCYVCQHDLTFSKDQMVKLNQPETALAVRAVPGIVGRPLAEYVCPDCEAAHCFVMDTPEPTMVGVNLYEPQVTGARCFECRKPLRQPSWPTGAYDGRVPDAPSLPNDLGLICPHCHAVCCVACCKEVTRGRTKDGSFMCPRCSRYPVDRFFHP